MEAKKSSKWPNNHLKTIRYIKNKGFFPCPFFFEKQVANFSVFQKGHPGSAFNGAGLRGETKKKRVKISQGFNMQTLSMKKLYTRGADRSFCLKIDKLNFEKVQSYCFHWLMSFRLFFFLSLSNWAFRSFFFARYKSVGIYRWV